MVIKAEKIVGWATNHCLSSRPGTCVNGEKLQIPQERLIFNDNQSFKKFFKLTASIYHMQHKTCDFEVVGGEKPYIVFNR